MKKETYSTLWLTMAHVGEAAGHAAAWAAEAGHAAPHAQLRDLEAKQRHHRVGGREDHARCDDAAADQEQDQMSKQVRLHRRNIIAGDAFVHPGRSQQRCDRGCR